MRMCITLVATLSLFSAPMTNAQSCADVGRIEQLDEQITILDGKFRETQYNAIKFLIAYVKNPSENTILEGQSEDEFTKGQIIHDSLKDLSNEQAYLRSIEPC